MESEQEQMLNAKVFMQSVIETGDDLERVESVGQKDIKKILFGVELSDTNIGEPYQNQISSQTFSTGVGFDSISRLKPFVDYPRALSLAKLFCEGA